MPAAELQARLEDILRASPKVWTVLETARDLDFPDWMLVSGGVYQTVWNAVTGRDPDYGIKDYDLLYHDDRDRSWDAEDRCIRHAATAFAPPLDTMVEVRNQARVHLWFEQHFGEPYAPLADSAEALTRFVCPAFAVGVSLSSSGHLQIQAPFGLDDVFSMTLRPNPSRQLARGWAKTTGSAQARWPECRIVQP